jgi:hypothetical protein
MIEGSLPILVPQVDEDVSNNILVFSVTCNIVLV